jgi:hypothetical protein
MRANLRPQFFSQRLAPLEASEELFEDADNDGVDADAFGFGPFLEFGAGFCVNLGNWGLVSAMPTDAFCRAFSPD